MEHATLTAPRGHAGGTTEGAAQGAYRRPALWIETLRLTAFRNYARADIVCDGRPVVLTGPNGAGKTNLLEAISFLAPGRGLRRARMSEVERQSDGREDPATQPETAWAVAARVHTPDGERDIGTGRDPAAEGRERRAVRLDGANAGSQQALGEVVAITWLLPSMDRLFQESPSGRRRFLDRLVFGLDPAHAGRVNKYEHAMRERARLLRQGRLADPAWLAALEQRMAETGVAIAAARRDLVDRLARACRREPGPFPKAGLGLAGDIETWLDELSALDAEDRLRAALESARERDAESGGAAYGPHRGDLVARHLEKDRPAEMCSTGEQKALLISLVLAHARLLSAERGFPPLVLLDEVAAHLDEDRRHGLFEELLGLGAQAWLTGTDSSLFDGLGERAQAFEVCDARIAAHG
jgi:DNA replication and repair protein RecF